jgi:hypothetical protein
MTLAVEEALAVEALVAESPLVEASVLEEGLSTYLAGHRPWVERRPEEVEPQAAAERLNRRA